MSTPFLTRVSTEALQKIVERHDGISAAIVERYCEWARNTAFEFNFADSVCSRLTTIFDHGTSADKAHAFAALVELGASHNRWYIMRCMLRRCRNDALDPTLAKRFAIELKAENLLSEFERCLQEVKHEKSLCAQALAAICK
jgi:hypothetical protein